MSRAWRTERVGPRSTVPRKIAVTGVSAVIAYIATTFFGQPAQIWSVTLATFIGGVALVVQLLVEFDMRMANVESGQEARLRTLDEAQQKHTEQIERLVRESYVKINEATELFALVEASALRTDVVTQFVKHSTQIRPAPALLFDFAQGEIARMSEFLKEVSRGGYVAYDGEDRDWLLGLTRHAQSSIDATSLTAVDAGDAGFGEGGLWSSDLGQRYLEVQRDAVQRGVAVRRVFILDRPDRAADPGLQEVCRIQKELGINVRILDVTAIPTMHKTSLFDFILFDDVVSYEVTPAVRVSDRSTPIVVNTRLVLLDARVRERIQRFRDLWASAREFSD
jgi:hypothetical protein